MCKSLVATARPVKAPASPPPAVRDRAAIHPCYPSATVFRNCHAAPALAIATLKSSGQYFVPGLADPARTGALHTAAAQGMGRGLECPPGVSGVLRRV